MKYKVATISIILLTLLFFGTTMAKKTTKKERLAIADTANERQKEAEKNRIESQRRTNPIMPAQA